MIRCKIYVRQLSSCYDAYIGTRKWLKCRAARSKRHKFKYEIITHDRLSLSLMHDEVIYAQQNK
jgi:hypothetical protein